MSNHYYLPAEWHPQNSIMLSWPHKQGEWGNHLAATEQCFVEMATAIAQTQRVIINAYDEAHRDHIQKLLSAVDSSKLDIYVASTNDIWVRDYGPITLINNHKAQLLDFSFNGWGNKHPSHLDNQLTQKIYQQRVFKHCAIESIDFILEGGSIETDGRGTLLTTEHCLLTPSRNLNYSKRQIENKLNDIFNFERIVWLSHGYLIGDDTDGHVDTLARFINEKAITYMICEDRKDSHYQPLLAMEKELHQAFPTTELIPLPLPKAIHDETGQRLPASYVNFLITNDSVLLPIYLDDNDNKVVNIFEQCFPTKTIHPINTVPLIHQYGGIHCASMQLPVEIFND